MSMKATIRQVDSVTVVDISGRGTEVTMVKNLSSGIQTKQGGTDREHESHNTTS